ncbi:MAG: ribose 5-phosphate isomerase B [Bdellovibrionota bacterium]
MKLRIASDHAGYELKEYLKKQFNDVEWIDLGPTNSESTHYPKYAQKLCEELLDNTPKEELEKQQGVLICGSGVGMSMQANRYMGVRAALCWTPEVAELSRKHNASNVLCLSARLVDSTMNSEILKKWLNTAFEGGRHAERIRMMDLDEDCECC